MQSDDWTSLGFAMGSHSTTAPVWSPPTSIFHGVPHTGQPAVPARGMLSEEEVAQARQAVGEHFYDIMTGPESVLPAQPVERGAARSGDGHGSGWPAPRGATIRTPGAAGGRHGERGGRRVEAARAWPGFHAADAGCASAGLSAGIAPGARPFSQLRAGDATQHGGRGRAGGSG